MIKRIIIAIILLPVITFLIFFKSPYPFLIFAAIALVMGLNELYDMLAKKKLASFKYAGLGFSFAMFLWFIISKTINIELFFYMITLCLIFCFTVILITKDIENDFLKIIYTIFPVVYITGLGLYALALKLLPNGQYWIFLLFLMTWVYDAGAYFTGSAIGRHKLIPELSPKKTIEGLAGGIISNVIVSIIIKYTVLPANINIHTHDVIILAILCSIAGQVGDIAESAIKRYTGVKNSSNLLSEHGGIMDKIDSILFNAPVIYFYIKFFILKQ